MKFGNKAKSVLTSTLLVVISVLLRTPTVHSVKPTWKALDARPLPKWYDQSKFGIFIHWGVFSVPSFKTEWFWWDWKGGYTGPVNDTFQKFVESTERKSFGYQDYAQRFTAELWDPDYWAHIFARSGAQYVVLTSKHHEGFCNWNSTNLHHTWNWNSIDMGPRRDLVGDLSKAVKKMRSPYTKKKLHFGIYHSLFEWYNPLYRRDLENNFTTNHFARQKSIPELYDLVKKYEPEIIWSDGYGGGNADYWNATEFLAWYATNSTVNKTAVWNDRWGRDSLCKHGSFHTCKDKFRPTKKQKVKYENCYTIDKGSWGYNREANIDAYESTEDLIHLLIETVAFNGNLLLNVGPRADGTLPPIFEDRLVQIGEWIDVNGAAIYGTKPWSVCQNETAHHTFYTTKGKTLYAIIRQWPENDKLRLAFPLATNKTKARLLGVDSVKKIVGWSATADTADALSDTKTKEARELQSKSYMQGLELDLPHLNPATIPCHHAWVIALTGIGNLNTTGY